MKEAILRRLQLARKRAVHAAWLVRYWVLWKYRRPIFLAALSNIIGLVVLFVLNRQPAAAPVAKGTSVQELFYLVGVMGWDDVIYYVVALVISAAISYATAPTPEAPEVRAAEMPQVKDGAGVVRVYGEVWINDPVILAWTAVGTMPITQKGGK